MTLVTMGDGGGDKDVVPVSTKPTGLVERVRSRRQSPEERRSWITTQLADVATQTGADLFIPTDARAVDAAVIAAKRTGGLVLRSPKMPDLGELDLINVAPARPDTAASMAGLGVFHTPQDDRTPYVPQTNRHAGRKVVICYRRSEINPGRYLQAALQRSGAEVRVETEAIDLRTVGAETDCVIFVEGPYPALEVTGETSVPVLFWAHHGEHHLHANVRLADRYRADAVLLAHSWHLAFWFAAPVHRFPFGMAADLLDPDKPLQNRRYDVAMVGAGLQSGAQYGRRQQLVRAIENVIQPERLGFREQVSASEMASLYGEARIVINEGGMRHYPITMRVLEAVGSSAVLLSDPLPGMDMLLEPGRQYETASSDIGADVRRILDDLDSAQEMVDSALETARGLHTYDHRVDELFEIARNTDKRSIPATKVEPGLASVINDDVEVQRVAQWHAPDLVSQLPSREVWDAESLGPDRLAPGKMETIALKADDVRELTNLLRSARRYLYVDGDGVGLPSYLKQERPEAEVGESQGVTRVDTMAPSYRIMNFENTQ